MIPAPPPGDLGQRLMPALVDEIAASNPERVLFSVTKTKDPAEGFLDVTAVEFARAVDRCAWHLVETLGPAGDDFPTLTYMGPQDLVYGILILATIKAGYKVLLVSPRNALEAHLHLLESTNSHTFLLPPNFPLPIVKQILAARPMRVEEIPPLAHWLQGEHRPFPYTKTFAEARSEPFVVLHTSGSTGMPKPIVQTHGTLAPLDAFNCLPEQGLPESYPIQSSGKRLYLAYPMFHTAGVSMLLPSVIYNDLTVVLGPFPPSAEQVNSIHVHGRIDHTGLVPMTLIDLAREPEYLDNLGRLEMIICGGGPCPRDVGDLITTKTKLFNVIGTTECGILPMQDTAREDWAYMNFGSALGCEFRHVSEDVYEHVIVRRPELDLYQGVFQTFPHLVEYPMKDLYRKHPTKENHWLYVGRIDDIITYGTGEKLNPVDMEGIIAANPAVKGALIAGQAQLQSALLIEPVKDITSPVEAADLLDTIWPSIEAANKVSPTHALLFRHMVVFTTAEKPMVRLGKGTVQRKKTLGLYEAELGALFKQVGQMIVEGNASKITDLGGSPEEVVKRIIADTTDIALDELAPDADLFDYGLDSLKIMVLAREFNNLLTARGKPANFEAKTIYSNHGISQLISVVSSLLGGGMTSMPVIKELTADQVYEKFSADMPLTAREPQLAGVKHMVVLLTGSTGSLGSYILDSLDRNDKVLHVYCLNRGTDSHERQLRALASRGLELKHTSKFNFWDADLNKPRFGLPKHDFVRLLHDVTHVIHNAWPVDFNLALSSFVSQIAGARRLVDFCSHSYFNAHLFFVSSISTVSSANHAVEESINRDGKIVSETGYGTSKHIVEKLLDDAARETGVPTAVCRVGQIAGPTTEMGMWSRSEWFPSLIASSKYLGKLPSTLGLMDSVDWIPVDKLGPVIAELALGVAPTEKTSATVFHAVNPQTVPWSELVPTVQQALGGIEVVPLEDWIAALRASAASTEDVARNPAIKLADFFPELIPTGPRGFMMEVAATAGMSRSLAALEPVGVDWMRNWLRQWGMSEE
jgi:thioester reductase-like protein